MPQPVAAPGVRVEALDPTSSETAGYWAARLGLPMSGATEFVLQVSADGLQLVECIEHGPGPVRVDFVEGAAAHRRLHGGGSGQMIAKAVGDRLHLVERQMLAGREQHAIVP